MDTSWELKVTWEKHGHQMILDHKNLLKDYPAGSLIVEIGSDRGEGSTEKLALLAKEFSKRFITVDMNPDISARCDSIVKSIDSSFESVRAKGEEFLNTLDDSSIALLYLDAYDTMPPGYTLPADIALPYDKNMGGWNNEAAWEMHLKASQMGHKKLVPGGLVCFDDVWCRNGVWAYRSKGYRAIPWLIGMGYSFVDYIDGSAILKKL